MKELKDVDKKEEIANRIKSLVEEINDQIHIANESPFFLSIRVIQNTGMAPNSSDVCVFISETISY